MRVPLRRMWPPAPEARGEPVQGPAPGRALPARPTARTANPSLAAYARLQAESAAEAIRAGKAIENSVITVQKPMMSSISRRRPFAQPHTYG